MPSESDHVDFAAGRSRIRSVDGDPDSTTLSRSTVDLPAIRVRKRSIVLWTFVVVIFVVATVVATVEHLRTFIIEEQALLTQGGRQRHRTRRRRIRNSRLCDETDEPNPLRLLSGWRSLSSCVEYDLSLRKKPLGDNGVLRLVSHLGRKEYATRHWRGQLRVLSLERQGITRRGAGYLARWLSADPVEPNAKNSDLVDVERIPTAAYRSLFINLEGNPIGPLGVKQLERAVEKARLNGIKVVIVGGGCSADGSTGGKAEHMVKLGPIVYTRKATDMPPWRLPVPFLQRLATFAKNSPMTPFLRIVAAFCIGFAIGRISHGVKLPYRLAIVRTTE